MNSSMHFVNGRKPAYCRAPGAIYSAVDSEVVPDLGAMRRMINPASASFPGEPWERGLPEKERSAGQRNPPTAPQEACSDHEPRIVRFLNGPDSPARTGLLGSRVRGLAGKRCYDFRISCPQAKLRDRLRELLEMLRIAQLYCPFFIGIDGIDQQLTSPGSAALLLAALVNTGATIICGVDGRYGDAYLLKFYLRVLGIMVVQERVSTCHPAAGRQDPAVFPSSSTLTMNAPAYSHSRSASYGQQGRVPVVHIGDEDSINDTTFRPASEVQATVADEVRVICAIKCTAKEWCDIKHVFRCAGLNLVEAASPVPATLGTVHVKRADEAQVPTPLFPRTTCIALKAYRHARGEHVLERTTADAMCDGRSCVQSRRKHEVIDSTAFALAPEHCKRAVGRRETLADHERRLRAQFAAAYRNPFAINRLLAELKL